MGIRIHEQPDSNFTVYNSINDKIIALDLDREALKKLWIDIAKIRAAEEIDRMLETHDEYPKVSHITKSKKVFREVLETHLRLKHKHLRQEVEDHLAKLG